MALFCGEGEKYIQEHFAPIGGVRVDAWTLAPAWEVVPQVEVAPSIWCQFLLIIAKLAEARLRCYSVEDLPEKPKSE